MAAQVLRKAGVFALLLMFGQVFSATPAMSLTQTFERHVKNGSQITSDPTRHVPDPAAFVRIGTLVLGGARIGFDSKHGLGIFIDF